MQHLSQQAPHSYVRCLGLRRHPQQALGQCFSLSNPAPSGWVHHGTKARTAQVAKHYQPRDDHHQPVSRRTSLTNTTGILCLQAPNASWRRPIMVQIKASQCTPEVPGGGHIHICRQHARAFCNSSSCPTIASAASSKPRVPTAENNAVNWLLAAASDFVKS